MACLEITNLCFQNRGPYSFRIEAGECVGLQGDSGAGKSLLLRAIADLDQRTGRMQLGDINADAVAAPLWRRTVGMLAAESGWWLEQVGDHFADFNTVDKKLLAAVGLDRSVRDWQISRLSTGEKQRLAIVRLLHQRPQCLLLDEPTANLDQGLVARVEELLVTYAKTHQAPMLWVSHDPAQLARVCHRCFFMTNDGLLIAAEGREDER